MRSAVRRLSEEVVGLKRVKSGSGFEDNPNTEWLDQRGFWVFYFGLLYAMRMLFGVGLEFIQLGDSYGWSMLHIMHSLITFPILHWSKGAPFWVPAGDQGEFDRLTFWEQIDHGRQYTWTRKAFTIVPIIIFLFACYSTNWNFRVMMIDFVFLLLAVIPKVGLMHRTRLFGINAE